MFWKKIWISKSVIGENKILEHYAKHVCMVLYPCHTSNIADKKYTEYWKYALIM